MRRAIAGAVTAVMILAGVVATPAATAAPSQAPGTLTWIGNNGPHWSVPGNWSPNRAPVDGDTLAFPPGPPTFSSNDLTGLSVAGIRITGNDVGISGNPLTLTGDIDVAPDANVATLRLPIVLAGGTNTFSGHITVFGAVSGTGPLATSGRVTFVGSAVNIYTGGTSVGVAGLSLDREPGATSLPSGPVSFDPLGSLSVRRSNQIADDVTIDLGQESALIVGVIGSTEAVHETVGAVTVAAGSGIILEPNATLEVDAGLKLAGGLSLPTDGAPLGRVVAHGGVDVTGARLILAEGAPIQAPGPTTVVVAVDGPGPVTGTFEGLPEGFVTLLQTDAPEPLGDAYRISYQGGDGNDVTLTRQGPDEGLVRIGYQVLLGRQPDPGGLAFWTGFLERGGDDGDFARLLTYSREGRAYAVRTAYQDLLGRPADPGGLAFWTDRLMGGFPVDRFRASLLGSAEYAAQPGHASNLGFVDSLYRQPTVLDRDPDAAGRAYWASQLDQGRLERAQVALSFIDSRESAQRNVFLVTRSLHRIIADRRPLVQAYLDLNADALGLTALVLDQ